MPCAAAVSVAVDPSPSIRDTSASRGIGVRMRRVAALMPSPLKIEPGDGRRTRTMATARGGTSRGVLAGMCGGTATFSPSPRTVIRSGVAVGVGTAGIVSPGTPASVVIASGRVGSGLGCVDVDGHEHKQSHKKEFHFGTFWDQLAALFRNGNHQNIVSTLTRI